LTSPSIFTQISPLN